MIGILIMTILSLVLGIILVILESLLESKHEDILTRLPGYNCGACGYGGCEDLAEAISKDPKLYTKCKVLRGEKLEEMQKYLKEKYDI